MRTTVRIDDALLRRAKLYAAETGRTLTDLVEAGLRAVVDGERARADPEPFAMITFDGGENGGVQPGIDLDDSAALWDLFDEEDGWFSAT